MSNRIPEEIKQYRPGPSTEIKLINGHYYVYMYQATKLASGKWGKKTGKSIGKIVPGTGFIPNRNYHLFSGEESQDEITVLEYGQYAVIDSVAEDVKNLLLQFFPADRALQIFAFASILYANNFVHLDQVQGYYEQSWLSQQYKDLGLSMGRTALGNLLDDLGRRTRRVTNYEVAALQASSSVIAIDGHAIRSCSNENDLAETGYKFSVLKEDQVNLLMGYDVSTGFPLFARMYRGTCNDKATIHDLADLLQFSGILFIVDRGFYSADNLRVFSSNDNTYIIPVPSNTKVFRNVTRNVHYTDSFYYRSGRKHARIEYMEERISDLESVYVFRDIDENEKCRYNYVHSMEMGKKGYTEEKFEQYKETFGVYVLQSNSGMKAEEIFGGYKNRWGIETFYQYLKNHADFNNLMIQNYYSEQGFSFIMLITGQIHQRMINMVKSLHDNTISTNDILLKARCMKMEHRGHRWNLKNTRTKDLELFKKIGFIPQISVPD